MILGTAAALLHRLLQLADDRRDVLVRHPVALLEQPLGDRVAERAGALPALVDGFLQRLAHDALQAVLELAAVFVEARQLRVAHHQQHVELVRRREQTPAGEHLGEHDADRKQVAALIERQLDDLLGRHVAVLALERAGLALVRAIRIFGAGDAEIDELDVAAHAEQHVRRRDVAMHDAEGAARVVDEVVRVVERVEHLVRDPRRDLRGELLAALRVLAEQREHVDAVDILHRDEQRGVDAAELERLRDLRMDELRRQLGFVDEHRRVGLVAE